MKKRYYFIIFYVLCIIILSASIYKTFEPVKLGNLYSSLYIPLEYNIDIIKTNMDEMTVSNTKWKWSELKETNLKDEKLKNTYNLLVSDIRTCYLLSDDLRNKTYKNMKILSFENKRSVTDKELLELRKNENCLTNFDKYNSLVLSDNQRTSEKIKTQIRIIIDYKHENFNRETFNDLLNEESITIGKVASLTNWLKIEYNSNKK